MREVKDKNQISFHWEEPGPGRSWKNLSMANKSNNVPPGQLGDALKVEDDSEEDVPVQDVSAGFNWQVGPRSWGDDEKELGPSELELSKLRLVPIEAPRCQVLQQPVGYLKR